MNLKEKITQYPEKFLGKIPNFGKIVKVAGASIGGYLIWAGLGGEPIELLANKTITELKLSFKEHNILLASLGGMICFGIKYSDKIENKYKEIKAKKRMRETYQEIPKELDLGDYQLLYLKSELPLQLRENFVHLLKKTHEESKHLPTVGVELGYSRRLSLRTVNFLNTSACIVKNPVPKNYTSFKGNSEIRVLPTNPYSFYWLMEAIMNNLPEVNPSVQVCVRDVNDKRMPWILSSLSLITPSCVLPHVNVWNNDSIGFPGAYVGQTVDLSSRGVYETTSLGQTNYYSMYCSDWKEIADAAFYASKIHALSSEDFMQFENELATLFGFKNPKKEIHENYWQPESRSNNLGLNLPYKVNENLGVILLNQAKRNLGLYDLEDKVRRSLSGEKEELTINEIERIGAVNRKVKDIFEKYTVNTPADIIYRCNLEEGLRVNV